MPNKMYTYLNCESSCKRPLLFPALNKSYPHSVDINLEKIKEKQKERIMNNDY